jgi:hypothetical protein
MSQTANSRPFTLILPANKKYFIQYSVQDTTNNRATPLSPSRTAVDLHTPYILFTDSMFVFSRNTTIHEIFLHRELKIFLADNMKVYSRNTGVYIRSRGR